MTKPLLFVHRKRFIRTIATVSLIESASIAAAATTQRATSFSARKIGDLYYNHYSNTGSVKHN